MAIYLIIKEVQNYTIVKPTSIEKAAKTMSQEFIPEMLFCPKPGFRLDIVNKLGYEGKLSLDFDIQNGLLMSYPYLRRISSLLWKHYARI